MPNKLLLTILIQIIAHQGWAFSNEKCQADMRPMAEFREFGLTSMTTTGGGQFTSSTGGCSAIGKNTDRRAFIEQNNDSLKQDIASGSGEYLKTLNVSYGCNLSIPLQISLKSLLNEQGNLKFEELNPLAESICTDAPKASREESNAAKNFEPVPGKAIVYIYRDEHMSLGIESYIIFNNQYLGKLNAHRFIRLVVNPGTHELKIAPGTETSISLQTEAGEVYFVSEESQWLTSPGLKFRKVTRAIGTRGVQNCYLSQHKQPVQ